MLTLQHRQARARVAEASEPRAPEPPPAHELMALQRMAGNQAVARLLAGRSPRAQVMRAITINGTTYTHGSRRLVDLFNDVVVPYLEANGYKGYGIKSKLKEFIRDTNANYLSNDQFLSAFIPWLRTQTRRVRNGKTTPVLKRFTVMGMSRPAWPAALKALKGVLAGDNVRHVVRNATLKRALDVAWRAAPDDQRKAAFAKLAAELNVPIAADATVDQIVTAIYKTLYLHPDNLFAGDGPVNQVIGFAADPVRLIGEDLLAMDDDDLVDLREIILRVNGAVFEAVRKVRADDATRTEIFTDITAIVNSAISSLSDGQSPYVHAHTAGDLVTDIGLGFGFDLIDGRVGADLVGIAARQARLLWSERQLDAFIASDGAQGNLTHALKVFLGLADPPSG
jgi:hypothetical protein